MAGEEAQPPTEKTDDNTPVLFRHFALYTYHANRLHEKSESLEKSKSESTVSDFLQKEATSNPDFSLSVISTSLNAENETDLRKFLAKKLSRGTVYSGIGNIANVEFTSYDEGMPPTACYYCLLRQDKPAILPNTQDDDSYCSKEYVVCYLAGQEGGLDLFRPDLDKYSEGLVSLIDVESEINPGVQFFTELSGLETTIRDYLERWHTTAIHYVCRCVSRLGKDVQYLIHTAMAGAKLTVEGSEEELKSDMYKFVECCSLSELWNQMKMTSESGGKDASPASSDNVSLVVELGMEELSVKDATDAKLNGVNLILEETGCKFDNHDCTRFCEDWANTIINGDTENPVFIRQVIDNFKLKAIQDMNTLKRLIRQAESNHYALYRSFVFLKNCGNGSILLNHAKLENHSSSNHDTRNVLLSLEDFISETGGFHSKELS